MSESYILHDVMRKVKADGLFDSIRRDLISDLEQKSNYLDLKSSIEASMSTYLSEYQWSPSLKKADLREKARRHIESSNLFKDNLPTIVNQYMQTCQEQLVQPRLASFVTDHIEHVYHSVGGTHVYRPPPIPTSPAVKKEPPAPAPAPAPAPPVTPPAKPKTPIQPMKKEKENPIPKKIPPKEATPVKKKSIVMPTKPEKRTRTLSPTHSPTELVTISPPPPPPTTAPAPPLPPPPTTAAVEPSPSPPPPVVRIASPLEANVENDETNKKKKIKVENESRKLRPRRPNTKYSKEEFETGFVDSFSADSTSPPPPPSSSVQSTSSKPKKTRPTKSFSATDETSAPPLDTPSSPVDRSISNNTMSPEYGTSPILPRSPPSPLPTNDKPSTSPRRLRPRRTIAGEETIDMPPVKTRKSSSSSATTDSQVTEVLQRSSSVPETSQSNNNEDTGVPRSANPVSKSFIWKPKISK